ncbi:MAG: GNAT family N-acetyltransferase [Erysipelotrichaceae bacterium]|nr:GNAT family N-acetyltransferase [Erysipelotrichaceae bacterium]
MKEKELAVNSLTDLCLRLSELQGKEVREGKTITTYPGNYPFCWYSRSLVTDQKDTDTVCRELEEHHSPLVSFTESECSDDLRFALEQKGYKQISEQILMCADLADIETKEDEHVRRFTAEDVEEWAEAVCKGFGKPDDASFRDFAKDPENYLYGYLLDGKIVGTLLLYSREGNAGLHEVSCLEEYRRKGIASALIRHSLDHCKKERDTVTSLQASPLGKLTYASLGYREYGKLFTMALLK